MLCNLLPNSIKKMPNFNPESPLTEYKEVDETNHPPIDFNYLKSHPEERIEHKSLCFTWSDFLDIFEVIKANQAEIVGDSSNLISKTFDKLTFHTHTCEQKIEKDEKEGKKTFIFMTKLEMDEKLKEKINEKKDKKFSFQGSESMSESSKEVFILQRVKYCINTIVKHLNELTKTNFNIDDSTENLLGSLSKIIKMEGFSEMLKEKTLPLEWFGLYLQSNIENIPEEYKKNNYFLLYKELIDESLSNLDKIKYDDSLNFLYNKISDSEKVIDISSNSLKSISTNEKKFEILFFIHKKEIPVTMLIYKDPLDDIISNLKFEKEQKPQETSGGKSIMSKIFCRNILEFCQLFPSLLFSSITDYFYFEQEINLKPFLSEYFKIIYEYVEKDKIFSSYNEEERKNIQLQIENFIHFQLYNKIFCSKRDEIDNIIFNNCCNYNWLIPKFMDSKLDYQDNKMAQITAYFVHNMLMEKCPENKIHVFEKIEMIISNILILNGFDEKYYNKLMLYVFINAKPKNLNSCFRYIKLFLDDELLVKYKDKLQKFEQIIKDLSNFNETYLDGDLKDEQYKMKLLFASSK